MKLKQGMKLRHRTSGRVFEFVRFYNLDCLTRIVPHMELLNTKTNKTECYQTLGMQFFDIVTE